MSPELYQVGTTLKWLLTAAWLLPLLGFCVEIFGGYWSSKTSKTPAYLALGCIGTGFLLSLIALCTWVDVADADLWGLQPAKEPPAAHVTVAPEPGDATGHAENYSTHGPATVAAGEHHDHAIPPNNPLSAGFSGNFYRLGKFGDLEIMLDYYIDGLTVAMFAMVTLIASCIHLFAIGYMSDELTSDHEDHQVHLSGGRHFHRPGRFYRFFAFLSLFSFSMLGLVLAGNIFQVFIFWELVGICSYFLIGFYVERETASTAANKAFIMNRIGDFGFLIGLMILWTSFGVFHFAETNPEPTRGPGLFQIVRTQEGTLQTTGEGRQKVVELRAHGKSPASSMPYWLLTAAGLGVFAGCVGKSAQFPLQTWLPDAMEGPTPVSALVHSATMVAAGVYLVGRFYPMFTPEVLLVIAYTGCVTLFIGATIAIVVTDIKQVLAYSTISQLGYMMLAMGVGGWMAGLFHLITHAFFKSLMFLCSGSVIHGCHHVQDMNQMGGLRRKMPITCWTMFVGVVAICGLAVPFIPALPWVGPIAFSGYHSKDSILATALSFTDLNPKHALLFLLPLVTAGITAFYMFRMWFLTFFGTPRDHHVYDHAHESPGVMTAPMVILAFFAVTVGVAGEEGPLVHLLQTAEPAHVAPGLTAELGPVAFPSRHHIHEHHATAGAAALSVAFGGGILAYLFYCVFWVDARSIQRQFAGVHEFLMQKWQFDTLYDWMWVRPTRVVASWCAAFDKYLLDAALDGVASLTVAVSRWDQMFDDAVVDRIVNFIAEAAYATGEIFRRFQTGKLRQYITFIALSVVSLFILLFVFLPGR